jgi:hypothetical protein
MNNLIVPGTVFASCPVAVCSLCLLYTTMSGWQPMIQVEVQRGQFCLPSTGPLTQQAGVQVRHCHCRLFMMRYVFRLAVENVYGILDLIRLE